MQNIEEIDILDLLPQRPPFVMVDCLTHYEENAVSARFTVRPDNIFVVGGRLTEAGLIECLAQTCAARLGYIRRFLTEGGRVKLGFIGAIRNLFINSLPRVGDRLALSMRLKNEVLDVTLVDVEARIGDRVVAAGEMKIFSSDIDSQFA